MSARQRVRRETFSVSGSDESGGLSLDAEVSGQTGDFNIEATVDSTREIQAGLIPGFEAAPIGAGQAEEEQIGVPGPGIQIVPSSVRVRPFGFTTLKNQTRRVPGDVSRRAGVSRAFLSQQFQMDFPSTDDLRFSENLDPPTTLPKTFDLGNVSFPPIPVPSDGDVLEQIDSVILTVEVVPDSFIRGLSADLPSVDLELPPEAFVAEVDLDSFPCEDLYPDIDSQIAQINQRLASAQSLQDDLNELQSLRSDILSRSNVGSLGSVTSESFAGLGPGVVQDWEERVNSVSSDPLPGSDTIQSLESTLSSVENSIEDIGVNKCLSRFQSRVTEFSGRVSRLSELSEQIVDLRRQILNAIPADVSILDCASRSWNGVSGSSIDQRLTNLENQSVSAMSPTEIRQSLNTVQGLIDDIQSIPTGDPGGCRQEFMSRAQSLRSRFSTALPEAPGLDCSDVSRFVRNTVARVETSSESFTTARASARTERRFNSLMDGVQEAREAVETNVSNENPCKSQLLGRLDSAESRIRSTGFRERRRRRSCDAKYPSIETRITEFEDDVINASSPVEASTFDEFSNRANRIIGDIRSDISADDNCRVRFVRRVNGALERLEEVGTRVRIAVEAPTEEVEQRQEEAAERVQQREQIIDQLRQRLNEISFVAEQES